MEKYIEVINEYFVENGATLFGTLAILVFGIIIINLIMAVVRKWLKKQTKIDRIAIPYIRSSVKIILYTILFVSVATRLGFSMTSLITILGAVGLALSLALQNSLSNMANGIFLMLSKPFVRGDSVSIGGVDGAVESIGLIYTKLKTANEEVLIPNSDVASAKISCVSAVPLRRCDIAFTVSHREDIGRVRTAALSAVENVAAFSREDPPAEVIVTGLAPNGVEMIVRVQIKPENYWPFRNSAFEELKKAFDREGIFTPGSVSQVTLLKDNL